MQSHRLNAMKLTIKTPAELGLLIRAARKQQKVRMDDVAGSAGVGPVFVREVERGKSTVQLGRVLRLLEELGIELHADVSDAVRPAYERLKAQGLKPLSPRRSPSTRTDSASTPQKPGKSRAASQRQPD